MIKQIRIVDDSRLDKLQTELYEIIDKYSDLTLAEVIGILEIAKQDYMNNAYMLDDDGEDDE